MNAIISDADAKLFPIQPEQIDTRKPFREAFDHVETEISARWLVRFCNHRNLGWNSFTPEDIEAFYGAHGLSGFWFNRLINPQTNINFRETRRVGGGWIVDDGERLHFTDDFALRCFKAAPLLAEAVPA